FSFAYSPDYLRGLFDHEIARQKQAKRIIQRGALGIDNLTLLKSLGLASPEQGCDYGFVKACQIRALDHAPFDIFVFHEFLLLALISYRTPRQDPLVLD